MCFENALQEQETTVRSITAYEDVVPLNTTSHYRSFAQWNILCLKLFLYCMSSCSKAPERSCLLNNYFDLVFPQELQSQLTGIYF